MDLPVRHLLPLLTVRLHPLAFSQKMTTHHHPFLAGIYPGSPDFFGGAPPFFIFIFSFVFLVIVGSILFRAIKGMSEWSNNNQEPVLTVPARVVSKRTSLSVHSNNDAGTNQFHARSSTRYFVTFEFSTGSRKEFNLSASDYGLLAEQDVGQLTFQGTRYQSFDREATGPEATRTQPPAEGPKSSQAEAFCPYCGAIVRMDFKFCPHCSKLQPLKTGQTLNYSIL
jgi:hypothetical protein